MKARDLQIFAWGSSVVVTAIAIIAWGQSIGWQLSPLSLYVLFPLFGLIAFSLMWSHYMTAALRQYFKLDRALVKSYFEATSAVVLAAILLHPGLLAYQVWRDGGGLPPGSTLNYLPPSKDFYILIAMFSFFVFLTYELRRFFDKKPWWKFVQYASDIAMILIYIHSLNVGSQLQAGWLKIVWIFYGFTLAIALGYIYYRKYQDAKA